MEEFSYSQEIIYQAIQQCPNSVIITDIEGRIEFINCAFYDLTGDALAEVVGRKASLLQSGLTTIETYRDMWSTITTGQTRRGEVLNRKKDQTLYWCSLAISPIRKPDRETAWHIGMEKNISGRKELEGQLQQSLSERKVSHCKF